MKTHRKSCCLRGAAKVRRNATVWAQRDCCLVGSAPPATDDAAAADDAADGGAASSVLFSLTPTTVTSMQPTWSADRSTYAPSMPSESSPIPTSAPRTCPAAESGPRMPDASPS